jgi:myo-inositol 2-dehydrogenase/D-chiro-inositol 1-dehydrogenase
MPQHPSQNPIDSKASSLTRRSMMKATAAAATFAALGSNFAHAAGSDRIKVGLVGCGGRGRGAAGNITDADPKGVVIHAIGDLFPDHIEETKKLWAGKSKDQFDYADRIFTGWDAYKGVLATDINYVILATPPGFRPMMIKAAIEAGKHVFAEKPVAVDAPGCRAIMESAKLAESKGLGIVAGTQRRHQPKYVETIQRIADGAIGKIMSGQVYWIGNTLWNKPRQPGWSDMEAQLRNWMYYVWLSGDLIVEQHVHNIDIANWVMGGPPKYAISLGGAQARVGPEFGSTYDHFATDFEYSDGRHVMSLARQQDGCYNRTAEFFQGTNGEAKVSEGVIEPIKGERFKFPAKEDVKVNPYEKEHADFLASIRAGKPLNEAQRIAESVLTAVMGRMSAYTGQIVRWTDAYKSDHSLMPAKLEFGPLPFAPMPIPGKFKIV